MRKWHGNCNAKAVPGKYLPCARTNKKSRGGILAYFAVSRGDLAVSGGICGGNGVG